MRKQVADWAAKNKVEVTDDYTSQGPKLVMNAAAEAQAKAGHDFVPLLQWDSIAYSDQLEPVDDVINHLIGKYGTYDPVVEYLAKSNGSWKVVPGTDPTANLTCCARISMLKQYAGIDITELYPAHPTAPDHAKSWTYDTFLKAAEACHKAGFPFGHGSRVDWRLRQQHRCHIQRVRCRSGECQRRDHNQFGQSSPGDGIWATVCEISAARHGQL